MVHVNNSGTDDTLLTITLSIYRSIKLKVKSFTSLADFFNCDIGLVQGEILSPALFSLFPLCETIKETKPPIHILFNLFDSLVASVLNYGCEVWGFTSADCIEIIHRKFCKSIVNIKMSTNNYALYKELGRYPLIIGRQLRIVKCWFKLKSELNANCILKTVDNCMKSETITISLLWLLTSKIYKRFNEKRVR